MRERSFFKRADWVLWTFLALFPLIVYLLNFGENPVFTSFHELIASIGINDEFIAYQVIDAFIGVEGYLPVIDNPDIIAYLTYFAMCAIAHLVVDILSFFPTLCHDMVDHFWSK